MRLKSTVYTFLLLLVISCSDSQELYNRPFPSIETKPVVNITAQGAEFQAEILKIKEEVIDHGFVWGKTDYWGRLEEVLNINESNRKSLGTLHGTNFSYTVSTTLEQGITYYVRSYVRTANQVIYGNSVSFVSEGSGAPTISRFFPEVGLILDTISIRGTNFSFVRQSNLVKFNSIEATVISATDTLLKAIVPKTLTSDESTISVTLAGYSATAEKKFILDVEGPWRKRADFPGISGTAPTSFFLDNKFYVGPNHSKQIWAYDPATNVWTRKADFPGIARHGSFAFVCDGKAYVGMGYIQDVFQLLSDVWRYDPASNTWTQMNNFPGQSRTKAESFSIDNVGYLAGGENINSTQLREVWKYTAISDSWQQIADAPIEVMGQSNFILDGKAYHLHAFAGAGGAWQSRLYEFNPLTESWTPRSSVPSSSSYQTRDNKAIAGGYILNGPGNPGTFFKYDPTIDQVTLLTPLITEPSPAARWGVASFEFNGRQYLVGGFRISDFAVSYYNETWEFNFSKNPK